jgi:hypothetical protein
MAFVAHALQPIDVESLLLALSLTAAGVWVMLRAPSMTTSVPTQELRAVRVFRSRPSLSNPLGADPMPKQRTREIRLHPGVVRLVGAAMLLIGAMGVYESFMGDACPGCPGGRWNGHGNALAVFSGVFMATIIGIGVWRSWLRRKPQS